jgi:predicted transcriptional regulator of viral defense system
MDPQILHTAWLRVLALAARQHGVVARAQLLEAGLSGDGIKYRVGVYAVGRPRLTRHGRSMAALLSCGPEAVLSHESAAALWGIRERERGVIEISVPAEVVRRGSGLRVHRRVLQANEQARHHGIPVTTPTCSLLDLAGRLGPSELEAAVNHADELDLVDPERLVAERLRELPQEAGQDPHRLHPPVGGQAP